MCTVQCQLRPQVCIRARNDPRELTFVCCVARCFKQFAMRADRVYGDVKRNTRSALLRQIERERDGDLIDKALLKNILDIFIEVRVGALSVTRVVVVVVCGCVWGAGVWGCVGGDTHAAGGLAGVSFVVGEGVVGDGGR